MTDRALCSRSRDERGWTATPRPGGPASLSRRDDASATWIDHKDSWQDDVSRDVHRSGGSTSRRHHWSRSPSFSSRATSRRYSRSRSRSPARRRSRSPRDRRGGRGSRDSRDRRSGSRRSRSRTPMPDRRRVESRSPPPSGFLHPTGHLSPHYKDRHPDVLYRSDHDVGRMYYDRDERDVRQREEAARRRREERARSQSAPQPPEKPPAEPPSPAQESPSPNRDQPTSGLSSPFDPLKSGSETPPPGQGSPSRKPRHVSTNTGDSPGSSRSPSPRVFNHPFDKDPDSDQEQDSDSQSDLPPYADRIALVRTAFPNREGMASSAEPDTAPESIGLGQHAPAKTPKPYLPWHPAHGNMALMHQSLLTGEPLPSEDKAVSPLDRRSYFHTPTFNNTYYHIKGVPADPPRLPQGFEGLQAKQHSLKLRKRNLKNPSVEVPFKLTKDLDVQLRRSLRAASYQEWFLGTARTRLDLLASEPDKLSELMPQIQGVLLSGIKAASDVHSILEFLHHTWTLLRRDSYLETADSLLTPDMITTLRRHSLSDEANLFSPEVIKETQSALDKLKAERTVQQALRQSNRSGPQRSFQPRQQQQHRSPRHSPRSGGNHGNQHGQNRPKWSPKSGRGKPKSFPKDNNNNSGK